MDKRKEKIDERSWKKKKKYKTITTSKGLPQEGVV
jgi:hypothetical protein